MSHSESSDYKLCLTTVDNKSVAKEIALSLVQQKLVACVNVCSNLTSFYQWEGEIVEDREFLLLMKTSSLKIDELSAKLAEVHPYEVPEFIVLPIESGSQEYLDWISRSLE
ncbi:divalent-cation tolerance protein CutA [Aliikangiella marina]|uniref:Divalent-cation tolerance protein CutA n=1 Tax=Aliikangiella marina TaxID=1712262 RepID=A0A545T105_9GAMM|nr:divalent-cation tolerance protein CutA [Aliikangiella marina]TQV70897.1 divalent-cation tolerance protein CutA [Aliikangiella marina]